MIEVPQTSDPEGRLNAPLFWRHVEEWALRGAGVELCTGAGPVRKLHYACVHTPLGPFWVFWWDGAVRLAGFARTAGVVAAGRPAFRGVTLDPRDFVPCTLFGVDGRVRVALAGTPFQERIWRALVRLPRGSTCSYGELAGQAGVPRAVRAAANAVGANPVALFVPCHRVLRSDGTLGGYRWGRAVKAGLLEWERGLS